MWSDIVHVLCFAASMTCAVLLARAYSRARTRILLWSALCFGGLAFNNVLLVVDWWTPAEVIDLSLYRVAVGLLSLGILLYGFIWEVG